MYVLGHIGLGSLVAYLIWRRNEEFRFWIVLIGSMLPDMIDKPIGALLFNRGRFVAHSLLVHGLWFLIIWFTARNQRDIALPLFIGILTHLAGDMTPEFFNELLWPLMGWTLPEGEKLGFLGGYVSPFVWVTEPLGLIVILSVGHRMNWRRKQWEIMAAVIVGYVASYALAVLILVEEIIPVPFVS